MNDQIESLIREIAAVHGIAVSRDDPILILQTINNRLMVDSAKAQAEMLDQYKSELEGIASRWGEDAKEKAERILTAALGATKEAMATTLREGTATAAAAVRREADAAAGRIKAQTRATRAVAWWNMAASAVTLVAAALAAWAALGH